MDIPWIGSLFTGRKEKAAILGSIIIFMLIYGLFMHGQIYTLSDEATLFKWGALVEMGMGPVYFFLAAFPIHEGVVKSFTFEFGTTFIITAAILNYFAIIDIADHLLGRHTVQSKNTSE